MTPEASRRSAASVPRDARPPSPPGICEESRKKPDTTPRSRTHRPWTEEQFFHKAAERLTPDELHGLREIDGWATSTSEVRFGGGATYGGFKLFFPELHEGPLLKITVEGKVSLPLSRLGDTGTAFRGALYEPLASPKPTPGSREGHRTLWRRFSR
jgi:hypothetical protein